MAASLNLRKFDPSNIAKGSVVIMIGKRNTGKSFLVKDLLYYKRDVPVGTVISATESANCFYGEIMPGIFIHDCFNPEIVNSLVKRQQLVVRKLKEEEKRYGKSQIDPWGFLILDDLMYDTSWIKDTTIKSLFMNGRHYKLLFMITMQYSLGIPPALRSNVDYIFILRENIVSNRKRLYEHYAGMFPTFDIFSQVMDQCTADFECLVIDNTTKSNKIEDMVFWYKADDHPSFKIGAPAFWEYHSNNYTGGTNDDPDIDDVRRDRQRGPVINVKKGF
tara:strand:- start:821 stop:1648 length:828 start_codon:yes stop_codon:yes gene_type:complete